MRLPKVRFVALPPSREFSPAGTFHITSRRDVATIATAFCSSLLHPARVPPAQQAIYYLRAQPPPSGAGVPPPHTGSGMRVAFCLQHRETLDKSLFSSALLNPYHTHSVFLLRRRTESNTFLEFLRDSHFTPLSLSKLTD